MGRHQLKTGRVGLELILSEWQLAGLGLTRTGWAEKWARADL